MEAIDGNTLTGGGGDSDSEGSTVEDVTFAPQWSLPVPTKVRFTYTVMQLRQLASAPVVAQNVPSLPPHLRRNLALEEEGLRVDLEEELPRVKSNNHSNNIRRGQKQGEGEFARKGSQMRTDEDEEMERRFQERFGAFKPMFEDSEQEPKREEPLPSGSRLMSLLHKQPEEEDDCTSSPAMEEHIFSSDPAQPLPASVAALFAALSSSPATSAPAAQSPAALPPSVAALFAAPIAASPPARGGGVGAGAANAAGPSPARPVSLEELFASAQIQQQTQQAPPPVHHQQQMADSGMFRFFGANLAGLTSAPPPNAKTLDDLE
jgi:hypothetical protein